jgi:hypothetical protein
VCDHETSWTRRPYPALGCRATGGHSLRWAAEPGKIIINNVDLQRKYWLLVRFKRNQIFTENVQKLIEQCSKIEFHENPSCETRVVPCGPTDKHTDTTKLIVASRSFTNSPEIVLKYKKFFAYFRFLILKQTFRHCKDVLNCKKNENSF